jgi:hypothetical protein
LPVLWAPFKVRSLLFVSILTFSLAKDRMRKVRIYIETERSMKRSLIRNI